MNQFGIKQMCENYKSISTINFEDLDGWDFDENFWDNFVIFANLQKHFDWTRKDISLELKLKKWYLFSSSGTLFLVQSK